MSEEQASLEKCVYVCEVLLHVFPKQRREGMVADKQLRLHCDLQHQRRVFIDCQKLEASQTRISGGCLDPNQAHKKLKATTTISQ